MLHFYLFSAIDDKMSSIFEISAFSHDEDQEDGKNAKKPRWDDKFHKFIQSITEHNAFNGIIMFVIFLNALFMALETEDELEILWGKNFFQTVDELFLAVYTVEFIMKIYAEPKNYWMSSYNLFDFVVLVISYLQSIMIMMDVGESNLEALRILRALRSMRTLRTVSFIRGLQVLQQ